MCEYQCLMLISVFKRMEIYFQFYFNVGLFHSDAYQQTQIINIHIVYIIENKLIVFRRRYFFEN